MAAFIALTAVASGTAADRAVTPRPGAVYDVPAPHQPPLASRLSAAAWESQACWRGCESECGAEFQACIRVAPVEACHREINACARACLRQCRLVGGPFLPWTE